MTAVDGLVSIGMRRKTFLSVEKRLCWATCVELRTLYLPCQHFGGETRAARALSGSSLFVAVSVRFQDGLDFRKDASPFLVQLAVLGMV
jgi:hypothetical protein